MRRIEVLECMKKYSLDRTCRCKGDNVLRGFAMNGSNRQGSAVEIRRRPKFGLRSIERGRSEARRMERTDDE